ncbi:hypothetical protein N7V09_06825 [Shewanella seohaensis]|uniref:hypothetical protein n=1 Tax=Shewanella seohaensis TaxID=755175 RepID=UPI00200D90F7|nr:hypothetical protein [Shewanella seohaensis]MCL1120424.1 hypothetical protein [Shewanella seohaensis]UXM83238.1 hypothetical protein N7V09_06825 [Shewanella seohaensis]
MLDFDRIKTSMIVFALEKELGNLVLSNDSSLIDSSAIDTISEREESKKRNKVLDAKMLVKASYFGELFDFAISVSKDKSVHDYLIELKSFCFANDIFEIRNAVSHSTKDFHVNYWYRAAAIATHPTIEKLNFEMLQEALYCAENNELKEPPEEWLEKICWSIPNNLPEQFEHSITSLIGRSKESELLKAKIRSPRADFISIIAPGGIGKTALVLDVLQDISLSPDFSDVVDGICFVTLKRVSLTADGLVCFDAIKTISEIEKEIEDYFIEYHGDESIVFEGVKEKYNEMKLILCIDNLETLLVESPETFQPFIDGLPRNWKVIVTSRVTVYDSSNMPLPGLTDGLCFNLAREYMLKRGITHSHKDDINTLVKNSNNNPLAIRLSIDLIGKGYSVPDSISHTKSEIVKFSYDNLIDKLSHDSIRILESLLAGGALSRRDLSSFLELTSDELAESIKELTATTLIYKSKSDEVYSLSDSIRELLVLNPRNLEVRTQLNEKVRRRNMEISQISKEQEGLNIDRFDANYIPDDISPELKIVSKKVNSLCASKNISIENAADIFSSLDRFNEIDKNAFFFFQRGRVFQMVSDYPGAVKAYERSIVLFKNPVVMLQLAKLYGSQNETPNALKLYEQLIEGRYAELEISSARFSNDVIYGYFISLLYLGEYEVIFDRTEDIGSHRYREMLLLFRAAAFKRSVENKVHLGGDDCKQKLTKSMEIFSIIFREYGYKNKSCVEFRKLTSELAQYCFYNYFKDSKFASSVTKFVSAHAHQVMTQMVADSDFCYKFKSVIGTLYRLKIDGNFFDSDYWHELLDCFVNDSKAVNNGFTVVKVSSIHARDSRNFVICVDKNSETYLVHKKTLTSGASRCWEQIDTGFPLCIKHRPDLNDSSKKIVYQTALFSI